MIGGVCVGVLFGSDFEFPGSPLSFARFSTREIKTGRTGDGVRIGWCQPPMSLGRNDCRFVQE